MMKFEEEAYRWALICIRGDPPKPQHFIHGGDGGDSQDLLTFRSRADARRYVKEVYGYIARRKDLRDFPCFWRMPAIIKIKVTYQAEI